jgi:phospholipid-binding lipoprotein MlaA
MKKNFLLIICGVFLLIQRPCPLFAEETGDTSVNVSQVIDSQDIAEQSAPDEITGDTSVDVSQLADSQDMEEQFTPDETTGDTSVNLAQLVDSQNMEGQASPPEIDENADESSDYIESDPFADDYEPDKEYVGISDPLEPINRLFFHFNDKLYFWLLKPMASGYKVVVPEPARVSVRNFFSNLAFPVRFVNCLLQGKFEGAGYEWGRFLTNSIFGLAGFFDVAGKHFDMKGYDEDLGQTLGSYGLGNGFYINWPILGPSSVRDTIGDAGDFFLDPVYYADLKTKYDLSIKGFEKTNDTSLTIGDYEDLKRSAMDPYIALRDAYFQYRQGKIKK